LAAAAYARIQIQEPNFDFERVFVLGFDHKLTALIVNEEIVVSLVTGGCVRISNDHQARKGT
jgi:hypothetical protein